ERGDAAAREADVGAVAGPPGAVGERAARDHEVEVHEAAMVARDAGGAQPVRAAGGEVGSHSRDSSRAPQGAADHLIQGAPGVSLGARHYRGDIGSPTILYFHGNGEVVGDHDSIAPLYHRAGLDLFVVDYRGYGRSGGKPSFAALVEDAHPAAAR